MKIGYSNQEIFSVLFDIYKDDTVVLKEIKLVELEGVNFNEGEGKYSFILYSQEEVLYENKRSIKFQVHRDIIDPETGEMYEENIEINPQEIYIRLPYYRDAERIELKHSNDLIFSYDICQINDNCDISKGENPFNCPSDCQKPVECGNGICEEGETQGNCCQDCGCPEDMECEDGECVYDKCGNDICEPSFDENYNTCPEDCPSGSEDGYCDGKADNKCDPDCAEEEDIDCIKPKNRIFIYVLIGVIFLVITLLIVILSGRSS